MRSGHLAVLTLAVMMGLGFLATAAAASPPPDHPVLPLPVVRTIEIDGRVVTVVMSITRVIPGNPREGSNGPTTTASVKLAIQDGALLPDGLRADRIRFEKVHNAGRVFFAPLTEVPTIATEFELHARAYQSDLGARNNVKRWKATLRLEVDGRFYRVPMGVVKVGTLPLP